MSSLSGATYEPGDDNLSDYVICDACGDTMLDPGKGCRCDCGANALCPLTVGMARELGLI